MTKLLFDLSNEPDLVYESDLTNEPDLSYEPDLTN